MAVAAAEKSNTTINFEAEFAAIVENYETQPLAYSVPEMAEDRAVRLDAAQFIGAVTAGHMVEFVPTVKPIESLYDAIQQAAAGSETARRMVETNVRTDVVERTIKTGHVMQPIDLMIDASGHIMQHGQSMESVQANSLRLASDSPQIMERTQAETRNAFRMQALYEQGVLDEYSFVVLSRAADNMAVDAMGEAGFFIETMSCAIQVTTAREGRLITEPAFVSGIAEQDGERHDAQTIVKLAKGLGVELRGMSATEVIDTPLLIHNSLIPNGAVDVVEMYDEAAGGTFFGEWRRPEDYMEYKQKCVAREQSFQPKVAAISQELLREAATISSRLEAVQRLHALSEKHMVEQALADRSIDARVFGYVAACHIEAARLQYRLGNTQQALVALTEAKKTAKSSSCPSALKTVFNEDGSLEEDDDGAGLSDCEFESKECPKCHKKNVRTVARDGKYYGDCGCKS